MPGPSGAPQIAPMTPEAARRFRETIKGRGLELNDEGRIKLRRLRKGFDGDKPKGDAH